MLCCIFIVKKVTFKLKERLNTNNNTPYYNYSDTNCEKFEDIITHLHTYTHPDIYTLP